MVDGISAVTEGGSVSEEFVGLILLPIIGNAAEHATAVTVACKDKMDLAIGVAVGSSMQVALLLIPLMIIISWIMGNDSMTLSFDGFQVAVMFVAVLLVNEMARVIGLKACCCNVFICEHFSNPLFYVPNMCQNHRCVCFLLPNYWAYKLSTWTF